MFVKYNDKLVNMDKVASLSLYDDHITLRGTGNLLQLKFQYGSRGIAAFAFRRISDGMASGWHCTDVSPKAVKAVMERVSTPAASVPLPPLPSDKGDKSSDR